MPTSSGGEHVDGQPDRKRRRSRAPVNWSQFYSNGLPKEVIVIDDSPEPEASHTQTSTSTGTHPHGGVSNGTNGVVNGVSSGGRHVAKKRKREEEPTRFDPVYNRVIGSRTNETPSGSTISSGRTNSAIHTTAATSLGSRSSNAQYDYETQPGQKRKRTRQQIANEAKKMGQLSQAFMSYQPPPHPPKKAPEVHVRKVPDVSVRLPQP